MFVDLVVDTFPYRTKKGSSKIWALGWLSPSHSAVFLVMVNAYILTEFWFWVLRCDINTWLEHVRSLCFKNSCSCSPVGRVRPACGNHLLSELLSVWLCGQRFFFFSKHFWLQDGSCDSWGEVSAFWKANIWPLTCVGILRSYKLISDYLPVNNEALTCPMSFPPSIYKTLLPSSALEI